MKRVKLDDELTIFVSSDSDDVESYTVRSHSSHLFLPLGDVKVQDTTTIWWDDVDTDSTVRVSDFIAKENLYAYTWKAPVPDSNKIPVNRPRQKIVMPPGMSHQRVAKWLFPGKTYERRFEPLFADLQNECFDALANEQPNRAKWLRTLYLARFWGVFITTVFGSLAKRIWKELTTG